MWKVGKSWDKECQGFVSAVLDGNGRGYSSSGRHGFQIRPKDQDLCDKDAADRIKQSFKELSGKDAEWNETGLDGRWEKNDYTELIRNSYL